MNDPSVLDYLSAKLRFWRSPPPGMPTLGQLWFEETPPQDPDAVTATPSDEDPAPPDPHDTALPDGGPSGIKRWARLVHLGDGGGPAPVAVLSAAILAALGLTALPQVNGVAVAVILFAGAVGAAAFAVRRGEVVFEPESADELVDDAKIRRLPAAGAVVAAAAAAAAAADNQAGWFLLVAWLAALVLAVISVVGPPTAGRVFGGERSDGRRPGSPALALPRTLVLPAVIFAAAVVVRTWHLASVPSEMLSVHAELILATVAAGHSDPAIVFPWGYGGLEPLAVYLGALVAPLAGGLGFVSLKLGTLLAGLATLPVIYLLGREISGRAAGLGGMALAAAAPWPDLVSRIGLTEGWYPPFAAAALLMLIRGARRGRRSDFVAAGVVIGLAIQTDSMARSLVIAAVVLLAAAWLAAPRDRRRRLAAGIVIVAVFTVVAGLPTLAAARPPSAAVNSSWWFGAAEGARDHGTAAGLVGRSGRVLAAPIWSDGPAWDHGGGDRPALDRTTAVMFILGLSWLGFGAIVRRRRGFALMLLTVPLALLPAVLAPLEPALAPSPLRCGGAIGPIFAIAGLGLGAVVRAVAGWTAPSLARPCAAATALLLVGMTAAAGHSVVHTDFAERWDAGAWNASELAAVVGGALALGVAPERARVVPHPHWVDTRLVAAEAGLPGEDLAIDPSTVRSLAKRPGAQLFLVHPDDQETLRVLREVLPGADVVRHPSRVPGKAFMAVTDISREGD